ncbi:type I methionyl aminopeptidase [Alloalcanivorax xenomutans]|jgi:methionyl aminopeptidase|uniref:type I methionyl aminopeptidase n=1 Tax=Alloalcanivorax xenomutans TaxID=1094342 RepID=UPI0003B87BB1|nr:type I methionyl aminopeptidase [Alloalcanivorax xenomutans]ERS13559.1 methionine aminopeptidase [Alcanivorax sp. PN-3]WOA32672.1 type I methionyl aminopeptidase [Alloalcanivorax xenomutans]
MTVEGQNDIDGVLNTGRVVARVRDAMLDAVEPGMTTAELDKLGEQLLEQYGARSAPRVTYDFPAATCISVNEEAAHGIPGQRVIQAGDIVNVDVSAELDGYFADTGGTTVVPPGSALKARLCHATRLALKRALGEARAGAPINRIGKVIQHTAKSHRFKVIKNLAGHGIGRTLHEEPEDIVGYYDRRDTRRLRLGQVIAIEPFLSTRSTLVTEAEDGWTLVGHPDNLSAQFEHTVIVTKGAPIIATLSEKRA